MQVNRFGNNDGKGAPIVQIRSRDSGMLREYGVKIVADPTLHPSSRLPDQGTFTTRMNKASMLIRIL